MYSYSIFAQLINFKLFSVYVDVIQNQCSNAIFEFGASSTDSRKYDIKILQFTCDDEMGNNNIHYLPILKI